MGLNLKNIRKMLCETCQFTDHCDGWEHSPYCINPSVEEMARASSEKENRDDDLPEKMWIRLGETDCLLEEEDSVSEYLTELTAFFSNIGYSCDAVELFSNITKMQGEFDIEQFLRSMLIHGYEESRQFSNDYQYFNETYFHRKNKLRECNQKKNDLEETYGNEKRRLSKRLSMLEKKREELQASENPLLTKARELEEKQKTLEGLGDCLAHAPSLNDFVALIQVGPIPEHKLLMMEIKNATIAACKMPNHKELMDALKERLNLMEKAVTTKQSVDELEKIDIDLEAVRRQMEEDERAFQDEMRVIMKESSKNHRQEFKNPHNAVQSSFNGEKVPDKKFSALTDHEKQLVREYIMDNIRRFRTKLSRKIRSNTRHQIDMPDTIRKACATNGVPMKIVHKKPVRQKTKLLLFLDVSGSCRNASEMMLYFMYALKEVFPGGCRVYAFTNRLYDVSDFFQAQNPDLFIQKVLESIPRAGAYSNYEAPFRQFYESHMTEVTGDSYIYIIGDARNNTNRTGEGYVKAISRKAKKVFWMNTERKKAWNEGDSVIGEYAKYMDQVVEITTPAQLLAFIDR